MCLTIRKWITNLTLYCMVNRSFLWWRYTCWNVPRCLCRRINYERRGGKARLVSIIYLWTCVGRVHESLMLGLGRIYDDMGMSYLFDLDHDESDTQSQLTNDPPPFTMDARYIGNVRFMKSFCSGCVTDASMYLNLPCLSAYKISCEYIQFFSPTYNSTRLTRSIVLEPFVRPELCVHLCVYHHTRSEASATRSFLYRSHSRRYWTYLRLFPRNWCNIRARPFSDWGSSCKMSLRDSELQGKDMGMTIIT